MARLTTFILLLSALVFANDTSTYEKGTITKKFGAVPDWPAHAYYELQGSQRSYQVKICADFSDGESVAFRLKGNTIFIRTHDGKDMKCPAAMVTGEAVTYSKGTIAGYETLFVGRGGKVKVYDLRGPDLIYQIASCGAFQAGEFTTGDVLEYRVVAERVYVQHQNSEYSCKLQGTLKLSEFRPADSAPSSVAAAPSATAKLSIASVPDGADIEVDGNFSGNTPSDLEVPVGEHAITVKKSGYRNWERKLNVAAGSSIHLSADLEKQPNP